MTHSQGKRRYPTVKATNGAVFELRLRTMKKVADVDCSWRGLRFSATRADVRGAMLMNFIRVTVIAGCTVGEVETYDNVLRNDAALALGCMNFNQADATKIRQWAKGAKRGK